MGKISVNDSFIRKPENEKKIRYWYEEIST